MAVEKLDSVKKWGINTYKVLCVDIIFKPKPCVWYEAFWGFERHFRNLPYPLASGWPYCSCVIPGNAGKLGVAVPCLEIYLHSGTKLNQQLFHLSRLFKVVDY